MRKITTYIVALVAATALFSSCKKEYETMEELDNRNISAYVASTGQTFSDGEGGYKYRIVDAGTGSAVLNSDSVYYSYTFKSTSGKVYNQTSDLMIPGTFLGYTDQFAIGQNSYVFKPIREVLAKLKRGGKATLILPSRMAFGKNGIAAFGIGSNETIVVDLGLYTYEKRHQVDAYEISTFITRNNLTFETDASGIRYKIATVGTGTDVISEFSTITANYTVRTLDGTSVETTTGYISRLDLLYKAWQIMLPQLKVGGKIRMLIPSHLGGGRPLDFDIEITAVTN